jgi:uroporphyrinogen III methyltransferase/synthase
MPGTVHLVGAGPGDPGLITVRGRDLLARAQVVVYDALVNPALLDLAPRAERVFVGKQAGRHSLPQEEINRILVALAQRHARVVRLKGGDPLVFGRGGEELLALRAAGVPFEVVPGITAGIAAPAYAGIPVTHRDATTSVTFLTGHSTRDAADTVPDLSLVLTEGTLCFYMGVRALPRLVEAVLRAGRPADTPAAVIEWGTCARQRTVTGTLATIAAVCGEAAIAAPALFVVGGVVRLRDQLAWFEAKPLAGWRIVVTHAAERDGPLEDRLRDLGATVERFSTVAFVPHPECADDPARDPGGFDWVVFTSVNAAEAYFARVDAQGLDARALAAVRFCAVGGAAAAAVERRALRPDALPQGYQPEAVRAAMETVAPLHGRRILVPRAEIARSALCATLRGAGADVVEWSAYHAALPDDARARAEALLADPPDILVFTNSHAARHFGALLDAGARARLAAHTAFASLGPVTSRALAEQGFDAAIEPARHELPHLIEALCAHAAGHSARRG